jgi:hypothetical protein
MNYYTEFNQNIVTLCVKFGGRKHTVHPVFKCLHGNILHDIVCSTGNVGKFYRTVNKLSAENLRLFPMRY